MGTILDLNEESTNQTELDRNKMMNAIRVAFENNATDVKCLNSDCGNDTFNELLKIKRLSAIASPTGQEMMLPYKVYTCSKCGREYDPEHNS